MHGIKKGDFSGSVEQNISFMGNHGYAESLHFYRFPFNFKLRRRCIDGLVRFRENKTPG